METEERGRRGVKPSAKKKGKAAFGYRSQLELNMLVEL